MSTLSGTLRLDGDAYRNGQMLGRACRTALRARDRETRAMLRQCRVAPTTVAARVADFARLLKRMAPHWLDEAAGLAAGSGVAVERILAWNCLPGGCGAPAGNNCTAFVWLGEERNLSFKIRDERNRPQQVVIRALPRGGTLQGGTDIGNLGLAHALTSRGLSGCNDTGGFIAPHDGAPQLNDCHLLRYFAEKARTVEDVPRLFDRLAEAGAAGGAGAERGCLFLFADFEEGLLLETARERRAVSRFATGWRVISNHFLSSEARAWETRPPDANTRLRHRRMTELLERLGREPLPHEVFAISRDRLHGRNALCNDDRAHFWMTISAQFHVLDRRYPERSVNYACCGSTRCAPFVALALAVTGGGATLAANGCYRAADRLYRAAGLRGTVPAGLLEFEREGQEPRLAALAWVGALRAIRRAGRVDAS